MGDRLVAAWHVLTDLHNFHVWLAVFYVAYLVGLGGWIVLQKREPVATVSWLLGLALLPYIGFIVYHYLGPQRITRHRLRRARSKAPMLPPCSVQVSCRRTGATRKGRRVFFSLPSARLR